VYRYAQAQGKPYDTSGPARNSLNKLFILLRCNNTAGLRRTARSVAIFNLALWLGTVKARWSRRLRHVWRNEARLESLFFFEKKNQKTFSRYDFALATSRL
jgi:hypothetical protein